MTFHMDVIRECLTSWVHLKILEIFMRKPKALSQRQLASILGLSRSTTQRALTDLGKTGLIKSSTIGLATYWDFAHQSCLYETLKPILEGLLGIDPPLLYLKKSAQRMLSLPKGYRKIFFGSVVAGTDTPSSDIDLCVILPGKTQAPSPAVQDQLESFQSFCQEKFGKTLNIYFINQLDLSQKPDVELHRNILKGMEV